MNIRVPQLRQDRKVYAVPGEGFIFLSDQESFAVEGSVSDLVVPLINGRRTVQEIAEILRTEVAESSVVEVVSYLQTCGHVVEASDEFQNGEQAFWSSLGLDAHLVRERLTSCPVEILSTGEARNSGHLDSLARMLLSFGVKFGGKPAIRIVICGDLLDNNLEEINRRNLIEGTPWFLIRPDGFQPTIGPLFVPGETACWQCLEARQIELRETEIMLSRRLGLGQIPTRPVSSILPLTSQALSNAAIQVIKYLVLGENRDISGTLHRLDPLAMGRDAHEVVRRPQCARCGNTDLGKVGGAPTVFSNAKLVPGSENGNRTKSAHEVFDRYSKHISPVTGIIRELIPSKWNGQTPLLSFSAGNNLAVAPAGIAGVKSNIRSFSSGKGRTEIQAKTSALCEALERFSGKFRGEEVMIFTSLRDLGDAGIHPNEVMLFSKQQYQERDQWNARGSHFQVVPHLLEQTEKVNWTPVWSLSKKRVRYLPTSYLFYSYPVSPTGRFTSWADSNGAAAGSSYEDAVLQGLYELIERDAVAIWWYNRLRKPEVDITSLRDPFLDEMVQWYQKIDREFWVLDLTTDLSIPAFICINRRTSGPTEDIVMGFGAHSDPKTAIMRAITEMNQFMPAVLETDSTGRTHYLFDDPECIDWWKNATLENQAYLKPCGVVSLEKGKAASAASQDIVSELELVISAVESVGCEVLVLDQTRIDVGLPVVKVLAPGLRHFWARFAPGRLYEVPVKSGDLDEPLKETELNPIAMFL